jgi:formate hydrogenlyase subunit 6/NADH:ubiquinone oxidoreductase subunit I
MAAKVARAQPWKGVDLPALDAALCTGCGLCPEVCPTSCLEMGSHVPWLPRPADCVSCSLCVLVCPAGALRMVSGISEPAA